MCLNHYSSPSESLPFPQSLPEKQKWWRNRIKCLRFPQPTQRDLLRPLPLEPAGPLFWNKNTTKCAWAHRHTECWSRSASCLLCRKEHFAHVDAPGSICCVEKGCMPGRQPLCVRCSCSLLALLTSERWCFCLHARQLPAPLRAGFPHAVPAAETGLPLWTSLHPCGMTASNSGSIPQGDANDSLARLAVICISIMSFKWARRHLDQRWSRHLMTNNVFLWHGSAEPASIHRSHPVWPKGGFWMRHASTAPHFAQNKPVCKTRAAQIDLLKHGAPRSLFAHSHQC